jgi:uncharacterized protein YcgI (DUF1989 family)
MRHLLGAGQAWAGLLPAGGTIDIIAAAAGAGVAWFAWSATDPFEQVSDAYTFMELRRTHPRVGDPLFSTLRRPLLALVRDDVAPGLDLLRHDAWVSRETAVTLLPPVAAAAGLACPLAADWPFALNVFARTVIASDGRLVPQPAPAAAGDVMTVRAAADLAVAAIAAGGSGQQAVILDVFDRAVGN